MAQGGGPQRGSRPRVAVLYEPGSFSPFEIDRAARDLCELVWVTGWSEPLAPALGRLLPGLGEVLDAARLSSEALEQALRQAAIDGLAVFTEAALEPAAELAAALGLPFHDPQTARRLRDRYEQRCVLRAAGMAVPAAVPLSREEVRTLADATDLPPLWPAVLKPRRGCGGRGTFLVPGPEDLLAALERSAPGEPLILEEYLPDRPEHAGDPAGDTVAVEMVVSGGASRLVAVTGRFAPVAGLREVGGFLPAALTGAESTAVLDAAALAVGALGVRDGLLEVEVKRTPRGPRILEINGGIGAIVPTLLDAVEGPSLLTWALRLALGLELPALAPLRADSPVAFHLAWLAPVGDFVVRSVERFDAVGAMPEVDRAWLARGPGDRISSSGGGATGWLAAAHGTVATHDALWPLAARLQRVPTFTLDAVAPRPPARAEPAAESLSSGPWSPG